MSGAILVNSVYLIAAILFIFGIKMLGRAQTARRGNLISGLGMLLAVVVTCFDKEIIKFEWIIVGIILGSIGGVFAAKKVEMTGMPELVALFNGFGGLASLLVGWAEVVPVGGAQLPDFTATAVTLAVMIGGVTFTGSVYAWGKLSGKLGGKPLVFPGQKLMNGVIALAMVGSAIGFVVAPGTETAICLGLMIILSLVLGITGVMPIGGGDMPVVISLLNSCSGLAAATAGFVIENNVLIVAGCLVGASGLILTIIMCKAMNRDLLNVLFAGFGGEMVGGEQVEGELKPISVEDAYYVLEAAREVVVIPGYGMAVAQAQHAVKELADQLEENGAEVRFAIHPVAGRMPGHMNVLLAEADVPYEQLQEMDDVNPHMEAVDVAIVIGANDVVNPAAANDKSSPLYGMPIIEAHRAKTTFCLKRGKGTGFSGIENGLFLMPNTRMLYGDAKSTVSALAGQFKESAS